MTKIVILDRFPYFATFATGGGRGWCDSLPGVSKLSVVELSGIKTADCTRRALAINGAFFFVPTSIFDSVMGGRMSNFRKMEKSSTLHEHISKIINNSDLKLSWTCFPLNSELSKVLLQFFAQCPGSEQCHTHGQNQPEGKLSEWPWLTSDSVKRQQKHVYVKH